MIGTKILLDGGVLLVIIEERIEHPTCAQAKLRPKHDNDISRGISPPKGIIILRTLHRGIFLQI